MAEPWIALTEALGKVNPSAPSVTQLRPLEELMAQTLKLSSAEKVYAISSSRPGNVKKQSIQSKRGNRATILVVLIRESSRTTEFLAAPRDLVEQAEFEAVVIVGLDGASPVISTVVQATGSKVGDHLKTRYSALPIVNVAVKAAPKKEGGQGILWGTIQPGQGEASPLILDPRVRRMLRLAIASSKAIMLVGPPGTGKTTILDELIEEVESAPLSFGLSAAPSGVLRVTPEESWSTRELVGGETIDDNGHLRFRPGHLLESIRRNEWLFIDEANRADMDKIFGALLTWLSDKSVTLGRASSDIDAPSVRLEWSSSGPCSVSGEEALQGGAGPSVVYTAGPDWRLVGTYNALDAQRVFRFGHALGRRFARVPVPPITVEDFRRALRPQIEKMSEEAPRHEVEEVIVELYAAHLDLDPPLGPALFLAIPTYVSMGLDLLDIEEVADEASISPDADEPGPPTTEATSAAVRELLAEGYLLGAGAWLANLDSAERDRFRAHVVLEKQLFSDDQWDFIEELLPGLA